MRSKLTVPLIECLGFPSELRAEEFPVYGFEGRKRLPTKKADFLLFTDRDFNKHREFNDHDINWVHDNSLLVVETKKPNEFPDVQGQAVFYSMWAKTLAYLVTDGERILGRFFNPLAADFELFDCSVDELMKHMNLQCFSYEFLCSIKEEAQNMPAFLTANSVKEYPDGEDVELITSEEQLGELPEHVFTFIRNQMGQSVVGMNKVEMLSHFLNFMDACVNDDFQIAESLLYLGPVIKETKARLYINGKAIPTCAGIVKKFCKGSTEVFIFETDYLDVTVILRDGRLFDFSIGYRVYDMGVSMRLHHFSIVEKILGSNSISIEADHEGWSFLLPNDNPQGMWSKKQEVAETTQSYVDSLEKLQLIEEYYQITFSLEYVTADNVNLLYDDIDHVYDGIIMNANCSLVFTSELAREGFVTHEPLLWQSEGEINLSDRVLFGKRFKPKETYLMPCNVEHTVLSGDTIVLDGCCKYQLCD